MWHRALVGSIVLGATLGSACVSVEPTAPHDDANATSDGGVPDAAPSVPDADQRVQYERDIQPIWDRHCVRCHDGRLRFQGAWLLLGAGVSWRALRDATWACGSASPHGTLVVPGDPDHSALWLRLNVSMPSCYGPMPPSAGGLVALDPVAAQRVRDWITQGGLGD